MSIINQMLKDLEKRANKPAKTDIVLPTTSVNLYYQPKTSILKYGLAGTLILLMLLFLLFTDKKNVKHPPASTQAYTKINTEVQEKISPLATVNNPKNTSLHMTPSILTAITLQLEKDTTSLRLLLSQDAFYQVFAQQHNKLILILENSRIVTSIPSINLINSAIADIKMFNQGNGNLKIIITLKPNVELTHLELNTPGKLPELQLDFLSPSISDVTSAHPMASENFISQKNGSIVRLRTDISMGDQYQKALQLSSEGHSQDAIRALTTLLLKEPDYAAARESLASLLITEGNTVQAEQVIKLGLHQRPYYPPYVLLKARILVDGGKIDEALQLLQLAPPSLATNPDYHAFIAALYQRQGQSLFAEKLYEQLLALEPNNGTWWMGLGISLENLGKPSLAMEAYVRAANSDHLSPELKIYAESRVHNLQMSRGET